MGMDTSCLGIRCRQQTTDGGCDMVELDTMIDTISSDGFPPSFLINFVDMIRDTNT